MSSTVLFKVDDDEEGLQAKERVGEIECAPISDACTCRVSSE